MKKIIGLLAFLALVGFGGVAQDADDFGVDGIPLTQAEMDATSGGLAEDFYDAMRANNRSQTATVNLSTLNRSLVGTENAKVAAKEIDIAKKSDVTAFRSMGKSNAQINSQVLVLAALLTGAQDEKGALPSWLVPDVTDDLNKLMKEHAEDIGINNPLYFKDKVKNGSEWDLKSQKKTVYGNSDYSYYLYDKKLVRHDAPGNIHYGYVGSAAIWSKMFPKLLYEKAGENQKQNKENTKPEWDRPPMYGDDPYDTVMIWLGQQKYYAGKIK